MRILGALTGALLAGCLAGMALITFAPCEWFGSHFEGACGYGAMGAALMTGAVVACIAFGLLLWLGFRKTLRFSANTGSDAPPALFRTWIALLVLHFVGGPLFMLFQLYVMPLGNLVPLVVSPLLLASFVVASWFLAPYRARHPALSLLALLPFVGVVMVAVLILSPATQAAAGKVPESAPHE